MKSTYIVPATPAPRLVSECHATRARLATLPGMTPTIEDLLANLAAEADAYRARVIRIDSRLWQLERRGADLHDLRERLHASAEAVGKLGALVKVA